MRSLELLAAGLWLVGLAVAQDPTTTDQPDPPAPTFTGIDSFANVSVYQPDNAATEVVYARTENLPNNTVLVAWNDPSTTNTISLYQSTNAGFSWFTFGSATSDTTGRQLLQPHILYINGTYNGDTGTVLLAVNAVDKTSTNIEVYASYDSGQSFALVSSVVSGGVYNSSTAVSHPYLLYHGSSITIYYTTKKDTQHASKIVQQTTTDDYDSWGTAIDVVASSFKTDEPGMVSVTTLPNNKYVFAFQYGLFNNSTQSYSYPIYYKIASSPENAGTAPTLELRTTSGTVPAGGPSITWTSLGGTNGTLVLSDSYSNSIFVNQAGGQGTWKEVKSTAGRAWAREVKVPYNDPNKVRFAGGAEQGQTSPSQILVTVLDLQKALASSK